MEPQLLKRAAQMIETAAHAMNEEAAILMSAAEEAGTKEDDARTTAALDAIHQSAKRLSGKAFLLLRYAERYYGIRAGKETVEQMTE